MTKVDIGIACGPMQTNHWWVPVMTNLLTEQLNGVEIGTIHAVGSALPDHNKNHVVDDQRGVAPADEKGRNELTDANRVTATAGFLSGDAEWIWWIDDDTVPPKGALSHLLNLGREFVAGVYFLGKPPHNPIAYYRTDEGTYASLLDYPQGALIQVDSVGMGCTLIHRSVYEKIMAGHTVLQRPNGSLMPIPKERVFNSNGSMGHVQDTYVENGVLHMPMRPRTPEDRRPWPFYALEYGRTEDHYFCELAAQVGVKPWLDTTLVCDHWKLKAVNRTAHRMAVQAIKGKTE